MDASAVWDGSMTTELKAVGAEAIRAAIQVMSWSSSPSRDQSSIPLYEPYEPPPALNANMSSLFSLIIVVETLNYTFLTCYLIMYSSFLFDSCLSLGRTLFLCNNTGTRNVNHHSAMISPVTSSC
jgi:hypothetical protein